MLESSKRLLAISPAVRRAQWLAVGICSVTVLVGVVAGCGGSHTASSPGTSVPGRATGGLTVSIKWPKPSRLIPLAAKSIGVTVTAVNNPNDTRTVVFVSPGPGNSTQQTIPDLVPTEYRVEAAAYPNADGTGVKQAVGAVTVTVIGGQNVDAPALQLGSTIQSIRVVADHPLPAHVGDTITLTAQGRTGADGAGDVVLTAPTNLTWAVVSGNVTPETKSDGTLALKANGEGDVTVTVAESESGKNTSFTFNVQPAGPPVPTIGGLPDTVNGAAVEGSEGLAINASGQIAGRLKQSGTWFAFRTLTDGSVQVYTPETAQANGINSGGDVIGTVRTGVDRRAFLWRAGSATILDLGVLNANASAENFSEGLAINDNGNMVGYAKDWCGCWRSYRTASFAIIKRGDGNSNDADGFTKWGDDLGTIAPLGSDGTFPTFVHTFTYAINNANQVTGMSTTGQFTNASESLSNPTFTYQAYFAPTAIDTTSALGTLDMPDSELRAINSNGDCAGWVGDVTALPETWKQEAAVIRLNGGALTKLPMLPGANPSDVSRAYGINNLRQVVGYAFKGSEKVAFVYRDGVMTELNTLLPANSGWVLREARSINDAGQITGIGEKDGKTQAFLLDLNQ